MLGTPRRTPYVFDVEVDGGLLHGESIRVSMNDREVGTLEVHANEAQQRKRLCVPDDVPDLDRWLIVDLVPLDPAAPVITETHVRAARLARATPEECPTNRQESPDGR